MVGCRRCCSTTLGDLAALGNRTRDHTSSGSARGNTALGWGGGLRWSSRCAVGEAAGGGARSGCAAARFAAAATRRAVLCMGLRTG